MKLGQYLKDRLIFIICLFFAMLLMSILLWTLRLSIAGVIFINCLILFFLLIAVTIDFIRRKRFYDGVFQRLKDLDQKYLLHELLDFPHFTEGDILCNVLYQCNKSMTDKIAVYEHNTKNYREYIETWVHEIKTPIASASLIYENNPSQVTRSIYEELLRIENYVEQSLFYARSNYVEKDYLIKKYKLKTIVSNILKQHAKSLIEHKTIVSMRQLDFTVWTDQKWIQFILGQLILNAVKYQSPHRPLHLTFSAVKNLQSVTLSITDNGIGIMEQDIPRVFEQGFTGENGRAFAKSTGMGLFICKKLCDKLDLKFGIDSKLNKGTTFTITFPIGNMHLLAP